jgi:hypothetical protein
VPGTSAHQARARPANYPLPCRPLVTTACACPRDEGRPYAAPHPGQVGSAEYEDARRSGRGAVAGDGSEVSPPPSDIQPPGCRSGPSRRIRPMYRNGTFGPVSSRRAERRLLARGQAWRLRVTGPDTPPPAVVGPAECAGQN